MCWLKGRIGEQIHTKCQWWSPHNGLIEQRNAYTMLCLVCTYLILWLSYNRLKLVAMKLHYWKNAIQRCPTPLVSLCFAFFDEALRWKYLDLEHQTSHRDSRKAIDTCKLIKLNSSLCTQGHKFASSSNWKSKPSGLFSQIASHREPLKPTTNT